MRSLPFWMRRLMHAFVFCLFGPIGRAAGNVALEAVALFVVADCLLSLQAILRAWCLI